jgi:hypothetical protein
MRPNNLSSPSRIQCYGLGLDSKDQANVKYVSLQQHYRSLIIERDFEGIPTDSVIAYTDTTGDDET